MLTFYGYAKCSTCRNAKKLLTQSGVAFNEIDITTAPPTAATLMLAINAGVTPKKLLNTSGQQYRQLNMKEKLPGLTTEELVDLLAANGRLIKRPIVTDGERFTVGLKDDFAPTWLDE
jgi:arsenate reductase